MDSNADYCIEQLPTNIQLMKWTQSDCEMCSFCGLDKESHIHLWWECQRVEGLWKGVKKWCYEVDPQCEFSYQNVILNDVSKRNVAVNFIVLVTKQYIYRQKCLKKMLNTRQLKLHVYEIRNT